MVTQDFILILILSPMHVSFGVEPSLFLRSKREDQKKITTPKQLFIYFESIYQYATDVKWSTTTYPLFDNKEITINPKASGWIILSFTDQGHIKTFKYT